MAKSKTKSSILRFAQQDYSLHSSHPSFAQRTPRPLSRSSSLVLQDSPSRDSTPPRPKVAFADIAGASREVRVYPKGKKRDMQRKPPAANPPPSPTLMDETKVLLVVPGLIVPQKTSLLGLVHVVPSRVLETLTSV